MVVQLSPRAFRRGSHLGYTNSPVPERPEIFDHAELACHFLVRSAHVFKRFLYQKPRGFCQTNPLEAGRVTL